MELEIHPGDHVLVSDSVVLTLLRVKGKSVRFLLRCQRPDDAPEHADTPPRPPLHLYKPPPDPAGHGESPRPGA